MGIDYAFRFSARGPDEGVVSDDDVVRAFGAQAGGAGVQRIDEIPAMLRDVIRRSLATVALARTPDPLQAMHAHFCDHWGRARWLCDVRVDRVLRARGARTFSDLTPGETDLWHEASGARRTADEAIVVLRDDPALVDDLDHAIAGLTCLHHLFTRADAEHRDVQFIVMP